jgi:hypothetical protein
MALRTSPAEVRGVIESDISTDISPFISAATALTDYVESWDDGNANILTSALLVQIETFLAAHFYAHKDQQFETEKLGGAEAEYQVGEPGLGKLDTTQWGKSAIALDISGCLSGINKGSHQVGLSWLGKPPSAQLAYKSRD